jgi:branched-chain amino acid transport system ATP-binding protein
MLEARDIHTFYGSSHVLHGVDFSVAEGEAVALMGRNGMGKTTLVRSLLGLAPPHSGSVHWSGANITKAPPFRIARLGIAYIPEGRGVFPNLSVRENLLMAARDPPDAAGSWTLARVLQAFPQLAERLSHLGAQLSGGEQQMLTIGRALLTHPRLLILDEATEGLAPIVANEIWQTIRALRDQGMAIVIVDKNFAALAQVAHRCVILVKGCKVFDSTPADLAAQASLRAQLLGV